MRVLIVDDDISVCNMFTVVLRRKNIEVIKAYDGLQALELVREERPHVVFLDVRMPNMDGKTALKEIKRIDPQIKVIMVTGIEDSKLAEECLSEGAYNYIVKPHIFDFFEDFFKNELISDDSAEDKS